MKKVSQCILMVTFLTGLGSLAQTPDQIDPNAAAAMMENLQKMQEDIERLKVLEPLTNDQFKKWFPETLGKLERISISVGELEIAGPATISVSYNTTDEPEFLETDDGKDVFNKNNKTFSIAVMDGAGSGATIFAQTVMMANMNVETKDENTQVKQVDVNGITAQQTYHEETNKTGIHFIHTDRFSISITGLHMDPEETWGYFEKFDLKDLGSKD